VWFLLGDVQGVGPLINRDPNVIGATPPCGQTRADPTKSILESRATSDPPWCLMNRTYHTDEYLEPIPFFPLQGLSTVPAGAMVVASDNSSETAIVPSNDANVSTTTETIYVFMMNISDWGTGAPGTVHGNGMMIKSTPYYTPEFLYFELTPVIFPEDAAFLNAAPYFDAQFREVWVLGTALYRTSGVYLARVQADQVEEMQQWTYLAGWNGDGSAIWSSDAGAATQVIPGVAAGEISLVWNAHLALFVVTFVDFTDNANPSLVAVATSALDNSPGLWSEKQVIMHGAQKYDWYEENWGGLYGGYQLASEFTSGRSVFIIVSLWVPYRSFLVEWELPSEWQKSKRTRGSLPGTEQS
jgi:hypothetical protein